VAERAMTITYRKPTQRDAAALAELGRTSFVEAFGHLYAAEDLNAFLTQNYSVRSVAADIDDSRRVIRVAEDDGHMLGYCKLGLQMGFDFDLGDRRGMELKQLYIRGALTGSGIGAALMAWAIGEAKMRGFDDIILSVWSGNHAAQRFYARHGFEKVGDTYFMVGSHRDDEYLFGLRLTR
jgi:diamine N-acetyltransferase